MLKLIVDKFKEILLGLALIAGPLLYAFGNLKGRKSGQVKSLKKDITKQKEQTDFYRKMDEFHDEDFRPRGRDKLVKQLRDHEF